MTTAASSERETIGCGKRQSTYFRARRFGVELPAGGFELGRGPLPPATAKSEGDSGRRRTSTRKRRRWRWRRRRRKREHEAADRLSRTALYAGRLLSCVGQHDGGCADSPTARASGEPSFVCPSLFNLIPFPSSSFLFFLSPAPLPLASIFSRSDISKNGLLFFASISILNTLGMMATNVLERAFRSYLRAQGCRWTRSADATFPGLVPGTLLLPSRAVSPRGNERRSSAQRETKHES